MENPVRDPSGRIVSVSLAALGVVYGDIGTSPLYAIKECFVGHHPLAVVTTNVLGVLSLIFWSLLIVISVKYLLFVMKAHNRGEGGILALMALIAPRDREGRRRYLLLSAIALFGAALLYGDGMITPAITVLSAMEGLNVVTPVFDPYVIPLAIAILVGLFSMQRAGTASIGKLFGPFMLIWFATLAAAGLWQIAQHPAVLKAVSPSYAVAFLFDHGASGFLALGAVFLVVTGGEALYADMGHFGLRPIRLAWFTVVLPALVINYFGQAALISRDPAAVANPFFYMFPKWALIPMVCVATIAASIASQAVISGAFSLTRQAVQLGYSPRVAIIHTSKDEMGQIYIPFVNYVLMFATIGLVLGFRSSTALASAYGVAVTTTMVITTILIAVVARQKWGWSLPVVAGVALLFAIPDLAFFAANIIKIHDGGWFPLVAAVAVFTLMTTWRRGRRILDDRLREEALPVSLFVESIRRNPPLRVAGTAAFLFRNAEGTPTALLHNLKHNKVLHERVLLLTIVTEEIPHVPPGSRQTAECLGQGIERLTIRSGFMEEPDLSAALASLDEPLTMESVSFFLGRETLIPTNRPGMALWREKLFAWMTANARSAAAFFRLPPNRVVELGAQIEL
jgi:KUP system potassium uptake protein